MRMNGRWFPYRTPSSSWARSRWAVRSCETGAQGVTCEHVAGTCVPPSMCVCMSDCPVLFVCCCRCALRLAKALSKANTP